MVAALFALSAAAGCGEPSTVIDIGKAQAAILAEVEVKTGEPVREVVCPLDVEVVPGDEFTCAVIADDGTEAAAELVILNEAADVDFLRLSKP